MKVCHVQGTPEIVQRISEISSKIVLKSLLNRFRNPFKTTFEKNMQRNIEKIITNTKNGQPKGIPRGEGALTMIQKSETLDTDLRGLMPPGLENYPMDTLLVPKGTVADIQDMYKTYARHIRDIYNTYT